MIRYKVHVPLIIGDDPTDTLLRFRLNLDRGRLYLECQKIVYNPRGKDEWHGVLMLDEDGELVVFKNVHERLGLPLTEDGELRRRVW